MLGGMIGQGSIDRAALAANGMAVFVGSLLAGRFCAQRKLPMMKNQKAAVMTVRAKSANKEINAAILPFRFGGAEGFENREVKKCLIHRSRKF